MFRFQIVFLNLFIYFFVNRVGAQKVLLDGSILLWHIVYHLWLHQEAKRVINILLSTLTYKTVFLWINKRELLRVYQILSSLVECTFLSLWNSINGLIEALLGRNAASLLARSCSLTPCNGLIIIDNSYPGFLGA